MDNSTHIDNSIDNSQTHTHIHNHITLLGFGGDDDASYLNATAAAMVNREDLESEGLYGLLSKLVQIKHFNMCKPESMNVFALESINADHDSAKVFNGKRWVVMDKHDLAAIVAEREARKIVSKLQEPSSAASVSPDVLEECKGFADRASLDQTLTKETLGVMRDNSWMVSLHHPSVMDGARYRNGGDPLRPAEAIGFSNA